MSKAQFQQMKSTEAVHIRLPHGIYYILLYYIYIISIILFLFVEILHM